MVKGKTRTIAVAAAAALSAIFYFLPVSVPYKMAFPLAILTLGSIGFLPWQLCLAFAFSCLGDVMGTIGSFPAQMGSFMVTHILLISYFFPRQYRRTRLRLIIVTACVVAALTLVALKIVPCVPAGWIHTGVFIYAYLICMMCWLAQMHGGTPVAVGAVLFLASDFILSWNKFVGHIDHSGYWILVPYFLGQICLFAGFAKNKSYAGN